MSHAHGHIVVAAYKPNQVLLERQLRTLMDQSLTNWTCEIGIDGKDTEAEARILALVAHDDRFSVSMFEERRGFYRNFERLLSRVPIDASWVALSDQDDDWFPEKLERLVPLLTQSSLAFGQAFVVEHGMDHESAPVAERRVTRLSAMMIDNQVTGSLALFRRELLDIALPFPQATDVAFHDHWLGICALSKLGITSVSDAVQNYVQHAENVIGEETEQSFGARVEMLGSSAGSSLRNKLDYITLHRWGWRVAMADSLLAQHSDLAASDRRVLQMYAKNRLSVMLLTSTAACILRRKVPTLRALALLVGAAWRPFVSKGDRESQTPASITDDATQPETRTES